MKLKYLSTLWQKWFFPIFYALTIAIVITLFFTNDFGLIDIHKTSIISTLGIDLVEDSQVQVTAQIAIPLPSENGENVSYTQVQGKGRTVADCLNSINAQTGFFPKLVFCRLILLGQSCQQGDIFSLLDYFYRGESAHHTMLVAMCQGQAGDLLGKPAPLAGATGLTVHRVLSEELKKSGLVSTVNLKILALSNAGHSHSCYMPYVSYADQPSDTSDQSTPTTKNKNGTGMACGHGGKVLTSSPNQGEEKSTHFSCRQTATFYRGKFAGLLDEDQSFALNLVRHDVRNATLTLQGAEFPFSVGLKAHHSQVKLRVEQGIPVLDIHYSAKAHILDEQQNATPQNQAHSEVPDRLTLSLCRQKLLAMLSSLMDATARSGCDIMLAQEMLFQYYPRQYAQLSPRFMQVMRVAYHVDLAPLG